MAEKSYTPPLRKWRGITCTDEGCDAPPIMLSDRCRFHDLIAQARYLTPEAFDRLRETLAQTEPLTEEERRERQLRAALRTVEYQSRDLARTVVRAADAGAPDVVITEAIRRGDAEVVEQVRMERATKRQMAANVDQLKQIKADIKAADERNER